MRVWLFGCVVRVLWAIFFWFVEHSCNRLVFRFRPHTFCAIVSNSVELSILQSSLAHMLHTYLFRNRLFGNRLEILAHMFLVQSSRTGFWCNRLAHVLHTCNRRNRLLTIVSHTWNIDFLQPRAVADRKSHPEKYFTDSFSGRNCANTLFWH